jgi:hypothetical protein
MENLSSSNEKISQFEKLLADLVRAGVDYAVVGGVAVILNGYHRQTADTDILVSAKPANIQRLLQFLTAWGEGWARELSPEEFVLQEGSIRVVEEFALDIFTQMRGHSLEDFRPRLRYLTSAEVRIPYLHPDQLIELKRHSFRDKDRLDVLAMQEILRREAAAGSAPLS